MGNRGRFGKNGDMKRVGRLGSAKAIPQFPSRPEIPPSEGKTSVVGSAKPQVPIRVRPTEAGDVDFLAQLSRKVFHIYGSYEDFISHWFQSGKTITLIAMVDKKPVGFAMIGHLFNKGSREYFSELMAIAVEPKRQGLGIGQRLLRDIEKKAAEHKVRSLFLHTATKNLPAQKLFTKHGYHPVGIKRRFYPSGQDAVLMSKEIDLKVGEKLDNRIKEKEKRKTR